MDQMAQDLSSTNDSLIDVERHRLRLEENVAKLQKSLQHWQTWEAEYGAFKEELLALGDDCTDADLSYAAAQFDGTLFNEKEIELLLEDSGGQPRSRSQVVGLLDRRIDYVQKNVNALGVSLRKAEDKFAASLVPSESDIRNEDGLPLTEIREELDEEGNIISSSITNPSETTPHLVEALRKAGVSGLPETKASASVQDNASGKNSTVRHATKNGETRPGAATSSPSEINELKCANVNQHVDSQSADKPTIPRKKSVSFAKGTKKEDATTSKRQCLPLRSRQTGPGSRNINSGTFSPKTITPTSSNDGVEKPGVKVNPAKDPRSEPRDKSKTPNAAPFSPVLPVVESTRDAELRRQMIEYNMRDIGSLVAEINLEEEGSGSWSEGEEDDDDVDHYGEEEEDDNDDYGGDEKSNHHGSDSDEDEDEDQFGRSTRRVLDDKYVKEMLALEKKLNSMTLRNMGPESGVSKSSKLNLEKEKVGRNKHDNTHKDAKAPPTKEVRFASELDIQDSSSPASSPIVESHSSKKRPAQSPISERVPSGEPAKAPQRTQKVSRFKNERNGLSAEDSKPSNRPAATSLGVDSKEPMSATGAERGLSEPQSSLGVEPILASPPQPPSGPHAATVIERPYSSTSTEAPPEPDDLDPSLVQQQVRTQYHNMRNRMIQRQGGFSASAAEEANDGRVELEDGEERKVSRFKAAKLRMGSGMAD